MGSNGKFNDQVKTEQRNSTFEFQITNNSHYNKYTQLWANCAHEIYIYIYMHLKNKITH